MRGQWLVLTAMLAAPAAAQDQPPSATAESIIATAREVYRPPQVHKPCKVPENANEIVVCGRSAEEQHVPSSTDEAIREGKPVYDGIPRAPDFSLPCNGVCMRIGRTPTPPLIVDLTHMPQGLSPEEAAAVYRAEDGPPRQAPPVPEETPAP